MKYSKRDDPDEFKRVFSSNLRHMLMANRMTQVELGSALDASQSSVNAWCTGGSMPSLTKIKQIANLLHCDVDALLTSPAERGKTDVGLLADPIFRTYVKKLYELDRESQRTIFFMIDKFSASDK